MSTDQHSSLTRWRARSPDDLLWVQFDEDFIAFHRPSGKTHFLNVASYLLLTEVLTEPRELGEIADEFVGGEGGEQEAEPSVHRGRMRAMLDHLDSLGLVDRE